MFYVTNVLFGASSHHHYKSVQKAKLASFPVANFFHLESRISSKCIMWQKASQYHWNYLFSCHMSLVGVKMGKNIFPNIWKNHTFCSIFDLIMFYFVLILVFYLIEQGTVPLLQLFSTIISCSPPTLHCQFKNILFLVASKI